MQTNKVTSEGAHWRICPVTSREKWKLLKSNREVRNHRSSERREEESERERRREDERRGDERSEEERRASIWRLRDITAPMVNLFSCRRGTKKGGKSVSCHLPSCQSLFRHLASPPAAVCCLCWQMAASLWYVLSSGLLSLTPPHWVKVLGESKPGVGNTVTFPRWRGSQLVTLRNRRPFVDNKQCSPTSWWQILIFWHYAFECGSGCTCVCRSVSQPAKLGRF